MKQITENELQSREHPGNGWFIIEAAGQHPARSGEQEFTQNLTPAVLAAVAAAGVPAEGLPVDRDHLSLDAANPTEAVGWVRELATCNGNLAARIEWTPLGLPLIQGRIYKHFSTVYPPDDAQIAAGLYTPTHLIGLALTNQPNNKQGQPPISNRGCADPNQPQTHTHMNPKILAKLGLAEGATDEEIEAAIDELQAKLADALGAAEEAAAQDAESIINAEEQAADTELDENERKECTDAIIENRDHGIKFTKLLCNSKRGGSRRYADRTPADRRTPAPRKPAQDGKNAVLNRAKDICREAKARGKHMPFTVAKKQAERELAAKH